MDPYGLVMFLARTLARPGRLHVYSGHTSTGALLVRVGTSHRVIIRPWNRVAAVGTSKLREAVSLYRAYKGHPVNTWVFVARTFRQSAVRFAESGDTCALIQVDEAAGDIDVLASRNMPELLLADMLSVLKSESIPVAYDFDGIVRQGKDGLLQQQVETVSRAPQVPKAFISYSWDSREHRDWVIRLSAALLRNGVRVLVDEWDLKDYNNDLNRFMETGIRESDFVLMICTEKYAKRANGRTGGVGVESTIITGEFYTSNASGKYIPLFRASDGDVRVCTPSYLKGRLGVDFSDDTQFEDRFESLLRLIHDVPRYRRPDLGHRPNLGSTEV
jgi:hypothetical protein